jgi:hypothetical protein
MNDIRIVLEQPKTPNEIHVSEIDNIAPSSCLSIDIGNLLDFTTNRIEVLQKLSTKLRYEGSLCLNGTDIFEVGRLTFLGAVDINTLNKVLYQGKQSIDSVEGVVTSLQQLGLTIIQKQINELQYYIKAIRPKRNPTNTQ